MASKEREAGLEVIAVRVGGEVCGTYQGLAGTFASFADACLRLKALPGFYRKELIIEAELKGRTLQLFLSGKQTQAQLMEIMDTALLNIVAFPCTEGEAKYFIEVKSEK